MPQCLWPLRPGLLVIGPAAFGVAAQPLPLIGHIQPLVALFGVGGRLRLPTAFVGHLQIELSGAAGSPRRRSSLDVSPRPRNLQGADPVVTLDGDRKSVV